MDCVLWVSTILLLKSIGNSSLVIGLLFIRINHIFLKFLRFSMNFSLFYNQIVRQYIDGKCDYFHYKVALSSLHNHPALETLETHHSSFCISCVPYFWKQVHGGGARVHKGRFCNRTFQPVLSHAQDPLLAVA